MDANLACSSTEQPKIVSLLGHRNDHYESTESRYKDIYAIIERLDKIANKLNSVDYPKNIPLSPSGSANEAMNKLSEAPVRPDGLVGLLIELNERDSDQYRRLSNSLIPALYGAVSYIEKHI